MSKRNLCFALVAPLFVSAIRPDESIGTTYCQRQFETRLAEELFCSVKLSISEQGACCVTDAGACVEDSTLTDHCYMQLRTGRCVISTMSTGREFCVMETGAIEEEGGGLRAEEATEAVLKAADDLGSLSAEKIDLLIEAAEEEADAAGLRADARIP